MEPDYEDFSGECKYCESDTLRFRRCDTCGGQGFRNYLDAPEEWGEDCPGLRDHLITCTTCNGDGVEVWCPKCGKDIRPSPPPDEPEAV